MCLCKGCDAVDITSWGDSAVWAAVTLCLCCGGLRYEYRKVCPDGQKQRC